MTSAATVDIARPLYKGKVRDIYFYKGGDEEHLFMVASDRISTYDVVHPNPIPDKGRVLTGLSVFWFQKTAHLCPNHLVSFTELPKRIKDPQHPNPEELEHTALRGRTLKVKRLQMFPVECVVRGYLAGSAWKDYLDTGTVCGIDLPPGLAECQQLPRPIFTPATKANDGDHDENISFERGAELIGAEYLNALRGYSLALYSFASEYARARGIILADTKFEFGQDPQDGAIVLGDEILTPDSSRFWPLDTYAPGRPQPSFDKQYVRDWAAATGWDKTPQNPPELPQIVIDETRKRYIEAYERLTERPYAEWLREANAT